VSEWKKVRDEFPEGERKVEIVGYWTLCCEADAVAEISILKGTYNAVTAVFEAGDGYFILPFYWRYLDE
jgi:hypothetical protein